ncbi:MAG: type II toxin-antitoxin system VapC family toxin [Anaerolineae bacterium]|nr:type II toxin-antitoxin system VapC family toxin [Anaerolineae bacterium]MDW7991425.1 type II toxin-antitoxin system VapC family toxin [Anaerolineae bacterium]
MRSVIDANIAIYAVLPCAFHDSAIALLEQLVREEVTLYVPRLWLTEVATGIRKVAVRARISPESARMALDAAFSLPVEIVSEDVALCYRAYWWAEQLGQMAVYDALYLALAEPWRLPSIRLTRPW